MGLGSGQLIDISVPVQPGMVVYEGDPDINLVLTSAIADGATANVSRLDFGVHTGTHIDAPFHFIEGATTVDGTPLDALIGPTQVVDATRFEHDLEAEDLDTLAIPRDARRIIFKTRNSELWSRERFEPGFIGLTEGAAGWLVGRESQLVGIDYLSIAPKGDPEPTHVALLEAGVVILEGLDLRGVSPGRYTLLCLPLRLVGADGAPARAILIVDES